ncbi:CPBP family glutamic-type intramembrane protease [Kordia jejudonensis]|uniref:CPBP family glutamic-type intramembrane protease n=1 Tax=Kordia jejudonensis TaxID=1348245 RepID=UPI000629A14B|nr:CPBP family glutamic-type intramembrane protease [Kordia jejudonensis]
MFITQAYKGLHEFWRYIIGTLIILLLWQFVGAIPFVIVLSIKVYLRGTENGLSAMEALAPEQMPATMGEMVTLLGSNLFLFMMIVSFAVGLLGVLYTNKLIHKGSFLSLTTSRNAIDWKRIFVGFFIVVIFNLGTFAVGYFLAPEALEWNFKLGPFLILLVISLLFLPLQTSFEEYFFRGYLMQGIGVNLKENKFIPLSIVAIAIMPVIYFILHANFQLEFRTNLGISGLITSGIVFILDRKSAIDPTILHRKWVPLLFTSVIFGVMHAANPEVEKLGYISMVYYIGTGLILGVMTLMDDGMELALGYHAGNNILTALLVTTDWSALQTDAIFVDTSEPSAGFFDIIFPVLIIYPIMLLILAKIYKWKNWKEKLFGIVDDPVSEIDEIAKMPDA